MVVVKPLAKLINVPGIQDFAHHAQELILALKAPGVNNMSAEGIIAQVVEIAAIVGGAMEQLSSTDADNAKACLEKLYPFTEYLKRVKTEIYQYQRLPHASKFALQSDIAALLARHDSELRFRTIVLCLDKNLMTDQALAHAQRKIAYLQAQVKLVGLNSTNWQQATGEDVAVLKSQVTELRAQLNRVYMICAILFF